MSIETLIREGILFSKDYRSPQKKYPYLNYGKEFKYQYERIGVVRFDNIFDKINHELQEIRNKQKEIDQLLSSE